MDTVSVCRCCLSKNVELINITSYIEAEGQQRRIQLILTECLNLKVQVNDEYPQTICNSCITKLRNVYSFRMAVINSHKIFKYQNIKVEYSEAGNPCTDSKQLGKHVKYEMTNVTSEHPDWNVGMTDDSEYYYPLESGNTSSDSKLASSGYFYCTCCTDMFAEASELYKHCCDAHPPLNNKGDSCEYCNELFPYPDILQKHKQKHLTRVEGQRNVRTRKASNKQKAREKKNEKATQCQYCGKSFTKEYYYQHVKIHQEKTYVCKHCGKKFSQLKGFKTHMDSHSLIPKYKCPQCDKAYRFRKSISDHIRVAHNKEKTKICPTCGKAFFSTDGLKGHLLTHTGIKAHSCHLCDKAYQKKSALKVHLRSHLIETPT